MILWGNRTCISCVNWSRAAFCGEEAFLRLVGCFLVLDLDPLDRKSTRLNSSHSQISYAVFCLKKKNALVLDVNRDERSRLLFLLRLDTRILFLLLSTFAGDCLYYLLIDGPLLYPLLPHAHVVG